MNAVIPARINVQIGDTICINNTVANIKPAPNIYNGRDPKNTFAPSNPENGIIENKAIV